MVDCAASQCVQKRKILKKDLLAWSKKVPVLLGLEEVSSYVIGRRRKRWLLEPLSRLETSEPEDWKPQLNCSFCDSNTKFATCLIKERDEILEQGNDDTSQVPFVELLPEPKTVTPVLEPTKTPTPPSADPDSTMAVPHDSPAHVSSQVPHLSPALQSPSSSCVQQQAQSAYTYSSAGGGGSYPYNSTFHHYLFSNGYHHPPPLPHAHHFDTRRLPMDNTVIHIDDDDNEPLDLSAGSKSVPNGGGGKTPVVKDKAGSGVRLKVPYVEAKLSKRKENKKSYTQHELEAAVTDIRSGKLGTRRAAALYGIPRSTLRNKIFRMDPERCGDSSSAQGVMPAVTTTLQQENQSVWPTAGNSSDWSTPAAPAAPAGGSSKNMWQNKLQHLRKKHDLGAAGHERQFGMPPLFFSSHHLLECEKAFAMSNPFTYDDKLPFLHELVRKVAEQRVELERELMVQHAAAEKCLTALKEENTAAHKAEHLKVPTFRPSSTSTSPSSSNEDGESSNNKMVNTSDLIRDSLKDMISKTGANQSVPAPDQSAFFNPFTAMPFTSAFANNIDYSGMGNSQIVAPPPNKKARTESKRGNSGDNSKKNDDGNNNGEGKPTKKTRPKRGQYRKYNHELLLEAVKAVQRGEMSVHRAGSYYGVPHSTLEYKVKERHLLRQKKPRDSSASRSGTGSSSSNNDDSSDTRKDSDSDGNRHLSSDSDVIKKSNSSDFYKNGKGDSGTKSADDDSGIGKADTDTEKKDSSSDSEMNRKSDNDSPDDNNGGMAKKDDSRKSSDDGMRGPEDPTGDGDDSQSVMPNPTPGSSTTSACSSPDPKQRSTSSTSSNSTSGSGSSMNMGPFNNMRKQEGHEMELGEKYPSSYPPPPSYGSEMFTLNPMGGSPRGYPPMPPMLPGFGWPPFPGAAPIHDPALAAALFSGAFSSVNNSASELLKRLQQKVVSEEEHDIEEGEIIRRPLVIGGDGGDKEPGELVVN